MAQNLNIVRIPTSFDGKFFRYWFEFLKPVHKLSEKEIEVVASLLKQRFLLSKVIKDEEILDKVMMSNDTKKKIQEECGITPAYFQVIMAKLRRNQLIIDNRLNRKYIPNVEDDTEDFKLILHFTFK